jgi:hypothetical protein
MGDPVRIDYSANIRWSKKIDPQEDAVEVAQLLGVTADEAAQMTAEEIVDALGDLDDNALTPLGISAFVDGDVESDLDESSIKVDNVAALSAL